MDMLFLRNIQFGPVLELKGPNVAIYKGVGSVEHPRTLHPLGFPPRRYCPRGLFLSPSSFRKDHFFPEQLGTAGFLF